MEILTVEQVLSWEPCEGYDEDTLQEIAAKIDLNTVSTTLELIKRLQGVIPDRGILWLVLREELIPVKTLHELSCWFAAAALQREREHGREPAPESWAAVETKWQWTQGHATDREREITEEAAWAVEAAWAAGAAEAAAWAAAMAATRAARAVAETATWAARASAWTAGATAWAAREEQLKMALSLIEGRGE